MHVQEMPILQWNVSQANIFYFNRKEITETTNPHSESKKLLEYIENCQEMQRIS